MGAGRGYIGEGSGYRRWGLDKARETGLIYRSLLCFLRGLGQKRRRQKSSI